jgi:hypothetical protein
METLCVGILHKQNVFFSFTKSESRRAEQVLFGDGGLIPKGVEGRKGIGG